MKLTERIKASTAGLSAREKLLVGITIAVAMTIVVVALLTYLRSSANSLEKDIATLHQELAEIESQALPFEVAKSEESQAAQRLKRNKVELFKKLSSAADESGVTLKDLDEKSSPVRNFNVEEKSVKLVLKKLSVDQVDTFLRSIEGARSNSDVQVQNLSLKTRFDNRELLDITRMKVVTWKPGEDSEK